MSSDDWDIIEPGVAQCVRAIEVFLGDSCEPRRCVIDAVVPRRVGASAPGELTVSVEVTQEAWRLVLVLWGRRGTPGVPS